MAKKITLKDYLNALTCKSSCDQGFGYKQTKYGIGEFFPSLRAATIAWQENYKGREIKAWVN